MKALLSAALCAALLLGCKVDYPQTLAPLESGRVVALRGPGWTLSKAQLDSCADWLKSNTSGWAVVFADHPTLDVYVRLKHSDGASTEISYSNNPNIRDVYVNHRPWDKNSEFFRVKTLSESEHAAFKARIAQPQVKEGSS